MDGGRRGNANKLLAPWRENTTKAVPKKKADDEEEDDDDAEDEEEEADKAQCIHTILQLVYTEESLKERRKRNNYNTGSVHQMEWAHVVASNRISLPERARKHYPGTTAGDTVYGISLPDPMAAESFKVQWRTKKAMLGKKHIIPVGNKTKGADETEAPGFKNIIIFQGVMIICYANGV